MKTTTKGGLKIRAGVKAGGMGWGQNGPNHNRNALKVKAGIKAGKTIQLANHSCRLLSIS